MVEGFSVAFEIVTEESAECMEADERGFIVEDVGLRDALAAFCGTRTNRLDGVESVEPNEWPCVAPRWITVTNGTEFETGACESRSLHMPESVTPASRRRIARLCGVSERAFR